MPETNLRGQTLSRYAFHTLWRGLTRGDPKPPESQELRQSFSAWRQPCFAGFVSRFALFTRFPTETVRKVSEMSGAWPYGPPKRDFSAHFVVRIPAKLTAGALLRPLSGQFHKRGSRKSSFVLCGALRTVRLVATQDILSPTPKHLSCARM